MWQYSGRGLYYYISVIIRRSVVNIVSSELGSVSNDTNGNSTFYVVVLKSFTVP